MSMKAAIIGGGVIGGGWAARFLLNGWDVAVSDPDPEAERKIGEVLANARRSLPGLYERALPPEGALTFHGSIAEAVAGATWVQESVPERLEIKHRVFDQIIAAAPAEAVIGSSTSGFKPSELNREGARVIVAHPFNPVYLLPLGGTGWRCGARTERAGGILRGMGMFPLTVRKEIDAHIADRFLEAVWREALWLVKDGVATTEEIDEAIRMGFGLRWAQMGLFETYRIAGGEAGMRHFLAQFGPCLTWPWTKLMDVPDFTDELVELIAGQSDAQSGHRSIRELERCGTTTSSAMMRALKRTGSGAGGVITAHEATLAGGRDRAGRSARDAGDAGADLLRGLQRPHERGAVSGGRRARLRPVHGNDRRGRAYIAGGLSYFTAENHIRYLAEIDIGDRITVTTQALGGDGRKLHLLHRLWTGGEHPAATVETLLLHVDLSTRRVVAPEGVVAERAASLVAAHADHPRPDRLVLNQPRG
jgi:carnitine 3-dehydrogenase